MGSQVLPISPETEADKGLRSLGGIRWLLVSGALLTAVSAYRLVQLRWATLPPPIQFLVLCAGALSVFGAGLVARKRLALPQAGSALLFLFALLVPVLSWGAGRMALFSDAPSIAAFVLGMAALLAAARRVLREVARYGGRLFLGALVLLAVAPPLLAAWAPSRGAALLAALALGAVFRAGSLHVNRDLFHRDRRDGVDRPVSAAPFAVLGALFAMAIAALPSAATLLPLALAIAGVVLVDTGEEYYAALVESGGPRPERWPRRSVALLAIGFSLLVAAGPLTLLGAEERCLPLVALLAAWRLLTWALRYQSAPAHAAGLVSALVAYNTAPILFRTVALAVRDRFLAATGVAGGSPALASFADLGFVAFLVLLALVLRKRDAPEPVRRVHAVLAAAHGLLTVGFALADPYAARLYLPAALAAFAIALLATRRLEWLAACHAAAASSVLALTSGAFGGDLLATECLRALGGALLVGAVAAPLLERFLSSRVENPARVHEALLRPLVFSSSLVALVGLAYVAFGSGLSGLELALAGAALLVLAHRLPSLPLASLAVFPLTIGLHAVTGEAAAGYLPALTLTLFAASYLVARRAGPATPTSVAAWTGVAVHALVGGFWLLSQSLDALFGAGARGLLTFGPRPLILLAVAAAFLDAGMRRQRISLHAWAVLFVSAYVPVQLWAAGLVSGVASLMSLAVLTLLSIALLARRSSSQAWCLLARGAERAALVLLPAGFCLAVIVSGWSAALLSALLVTLARVAGPQEQVEASAGRRRLGGGDPLGVVRRRERRPLLLLALALFQTAVALHGATSGVLVLDVLSGAWPLMPLLLAAALLWHLTADLLDVSLTPELEAFSVLLEVMALMIYVAVAVSGALLAPWTEAALVLSALGYAARHATLAWTRRREAHAWCLQVALGVTVLEAFACGWLHIGSGRSPLVLLAGAVVVWTAARLLSRTDRRDVFERPLLLSAHLLPCLAATLSVLRTAAGMPDGAWWRVLPAFLASAFFLVMASREERRAVPAALSTLFLAAGFMALVHATPFLGPELHFLGPGLGLLALSRLLSREMGPHWTRRVFTAGATLVYATPALMLRHELAWGWQAALLVLALFFGAASFSLKSRSLLTVSTAAFLVDLGCFVLKVQQTEPMALWVLGAALGLSTMGLAAWLEWRREGVLQQIRIFLNRLEAWD